MIVMGGMKQADLSENGLLFSENGDMIRFAFSVVNRLL